ncbi:modular serine protease isoform X2 [Ceratina calcarata]|uniref:Modular serine protease isoform X2 n=1 Tax=Ceratina calcarata TaxID=156304 RepID=A0AAJ7JDY2_9HYME|nr:modular serine protease isoform X2 [Ceratina calcarata]
MKNTVPAVILILTYSLTEHGYAQSNRCGIGKFRCKNSECISSELLCDGQEDCADQSDETAEECNKPEITCGDYLFRCSYGACVSGNAPCNGIKDCADNSDETLPRCRRNSDSTIRTCKADEFNCTNGQCINRDGLCDGKADCADASDETYFQCGDIPCTGYAFRCDYGACINGNFKCNGINDCVNGSDEDPKLCKTERPERPTYPRPTPSPPTRSTPPTRPSVPPSVKPLIGCIVPKQPKNGHWKLERSQCPQTDDDCDIAQGVQLEPGANLVYGCNTGFKLNGHGSVFCARDGKWSDIPECIEIRCRSLYSPSVIADCTNINGFPGSCDSATPGTTANLNCRGGYRPETTLLKNVQYRCNVTGHWQPEPIRCIPACGVPASPTLIPTIVNGTAANISEFPWHATIYTSETSDGEKRFICGATIIHEKLLVTAAHCVFNERRRQFDEPSNYYIATGNVFRDYDFPGHNAHVKKRRVKSIYNICGYIGYEGNYALDIALLELDKPLQFTELLRPVCLDSSDTDLESGSLGKVPGFGRTHLGPSSFLLQAITVPYIGYNECRSFIRINNESYKLLTQDKLCAGYTNGSAVCDGDSGGGLVFKKGELWYLKGIVSVSVGTLQLGAERVCNSYSYSLYTRVSMHIQWIQNVILRLENQQLPPCLNSY